MAVGEDSDRKVSPCAVAGGDNVEVDTWNQVVLRSLRVVYDSEDGARVSQQLHFGDEGES